MTFYFYDLETSGTSPKYDRIMQFAGQRTDKHLKPIGASHNFLIKMTEDVLPDPYAIMITGITPQKTRKQGITEAEFLRIFTEEIATEGTVFAGFNSVRFDDEFMRYLHFRNFYDPYGWQWRDGRGRWDLLDLSRMTRALRPEGIKWPFAPDGKPSNRLELLASANKLQHSSAHDALSDVMATIQLAGLIKTKQPKLFAYLLKLKDKKAVEKIVETGEPFIYTSGKYPGEFEKTTVVCKVASHPKRQAALVWDLRHDPEMFSGMSPVQIAGAWRWHPPEEERLKLPVKTLQYNRCPAVAPLSVLDDSSKQRLSLDTEELEKNLNKLSELPGWPDKLLAALEILDEEQQLRLVDNEQDAEARLYDGFLSSYDQNVVRDVRDAPADKISLMAPRLKDSRLKALLPRYKARNFPGNLTNEEKIDWKKYCQQKLDSAKDSALKRYELNLSEVSKQPRLTTKQKHSLKDLKAWGDAVRSGWS